MCATPDFLTWTMGPQRSHGDLLTRDTAHHVRASHEDPPFRYHDHNVGERRPIGCFPLLRRPAPRRLAVPVRRPGPNSEDLPTASSASTPSTNRAYRSATTDHR